MLSRCSHFRRHARHHHQLTNPTTARLHNCYKGLSGAWQLDEPIDSFLARLPPATTDWQPGLDWIWVANPHVAPGGPDVALTRFLEYGIERLALCSETMDCTGEVVQEKWQVVQDLRELAAACNLVTGKWMLFVKPGNVNNVWAKVARATANDELGIGAKVATRTDPREARLVCVYTRDFRDKDDVARVLNRLTELELVNPRGRRVYYKTGQLSSLHPALDIRLTASSDAWTHLGIYGNNPLGIKASEVGSIPLPRTAHGRS